MEQLAIFSGIDANTLRALESGTLRDISYQNLAALLQLLSLSFGGLSTEARRSKRGLWMAAKNVSVSYQLEISPDILSAILRSGVCPPEYVSNIGSFLDETPLELVIMSVEETADDAQARAHIWRLMSKMASQLGSARMYCGDLE